MRTRLLILFPLLLAFAACSAAPPVKTFTYTAPETPGSRLCVAQCGEARDYCREDCTLDQRQCTSKVQAQALIDYEKYMSEQFLHSNVIELRARDFERMGPCNDDFKNCADTCNDRYRSCYTTCGGKVEIYSACQFMCF